jgi:2'-5' RNA ligase
VAPTPSEVPVNEGGDLLRRTLPDGVRPVVHRCGRAALTADADGSHTQGGMIALMPTPEDAERLAIPGGEPASELHLTLAYLGSDMSIFSEEDRAALVEGVRRETRYLSSITAKVFGAALWNGDGDEPAWVWSVGDLPDGGSLEAAHEAAEEAVWVAEIPAPPQHTPWAAHVCAAYSDDPALLGELNARLGEVTFDRVRVSFGDDDTDIPLTGEAVTAAGPLRREPTTLEAASRCDFTTVHREWEDATARATGALRTITAGWRLALRGQIVRSLTDDDPTDVPDLSVDTLEAATTLLSFMEEYAVAAGRTMEEEARRQGVSVPPWTVPDGDDDALTAALTGRRLLESVSRIVSDLAASTLVQAAKRALVRRLRTDAAPATVATEVDRELDRMDDTAVQAAVGQAMTAAQNAGRLAVMEAAEPARSYVASEILDGRTCEPCKAIDGRTFTTLANAVAEYPVMGFKDCTGARYGNACRGFIVAVWQEVREDAATTASAHRHYLHGTPGRPSYRKYHPKSGAAQAGRKTQHRNGGWLGSNRFTEREHDMALGSYTSRGYKTINECLRTDCQGSEDEVAQTRERISTLSDLVNIQDPTTEEMRTYRGVRGIRLDLAEGDEFHDRGFVSTTRDENFAKGWISGWGTIVRIKVPKGSQVLDVTALGGPGSEREVILPPGSKFRVTRAQVPDSPMEAVVLDVELING